MRSGHEGIRRGDDFARDAERLKRRQQRDRGVGKRLMCFTPRWLAELLLQLLVEWPAIGQDAIVPDCFQRRNEFFERRQAGLRYIDLFVFHDAVEELGIIAQWAWYEHHGLTCSQADQNMMPKSVSGFRTTSYSNYMQHDCLHGSRPRSIAARWKRSLLIFRRRIMHSWSSSQTPSRPAGTTSISPCFCSRRCSRPSQRHCARTSRPN